MPGFATCALNAYSRRDSNPQHPDPKSDASTVGPRELAYQEGRRREEPSPVRPNTNTRSVGLETTPQAERHQAATRCPQPVILVGGVQAVD